MYRKNGNEMQEMLWQKGINFNDYPAFFKRGTFIQRRKVLRYLTETELARIPEDKRPNGPIMRTEIAVLDMPIFTKVMNREEVIFDGAEPEVFPED